MKQMNKFHLVYYIKKVEIQKFGFRKRIKKSTYVNQFQLSDLGLCFLLLMEQQINLVFRWDLSGVHEAPSMQLSDIHWESGSIKLKSCHKNERIIQLNS